MVNYSKTAAEVVVKVTWPPLENCFADDELTDF
jgi:hypothetical protein